MKCPICGEEWWSSKCPHYVEEYIEEIAKLNKMLGSNQLGCEKEIERLKKEVEHWKEEGRKAAELYV